MMNDVRAREKMSQAAVAVLDEIVNRAEMLTNVTGMKPTVFMNRGTARLFAGGLWVEYQKINLKNVDKMMLAGYDVTICDVKDGVYVGYRI